MLPEKRRKTGAPDSTVPCSDGVPAGYCPHCNYRIDPGVCPECGKNVSAGLLRTEPRPVRLRKWLKRAIALALVLNVLIGGRAIFRSNIWKKWVPTSYLIWQQPSSGWTQDELIHRLANGALSNNEVFDFVQAACPAEMRVQSPHPLGIPVTIRLSEKGVLAADSNLPELIRSVRLQRISIDGKIINHGPFGFAQGPVFGGGVESPETLSTWYPSVGTYEIEVEQIDILDLRPAFNAPSAPGFPMKREGRLSKSIEIVDRNLSELVSGEFNTQLADEVSSQLTLAVSGIAGESKLSVYLGSSAPTSTIAGTFDIHDSISGELLGSHDIVVKRKTSTTGYLFDVDSPKPIPSGGMYLDITISPSLVSAFNSGDRRYFSGCIHWRNLKLVLLRPVQPWGYDPPTSDLSKPEYSQHPHSTSEWHPDQTRAANLDGDKKRQ